MANKFSGWFSRIGLAAGAILIATSILLTHSAVAANVAFPNTPVNCDSNAVIWCGARDLSTLQSAYHADTSVSAIYTGFFISGAMIDNMQNTAVAGQVTSDGKVLVNNKVVATKAVTAGRQNMTGSTKAMTNGVIYYVRPTSVSFASSSLDAYVVMNNDKFLFAVLASCGNPVLATPVSSATPPAPVSTQSTPQPPKPSPSPTPANTSSSSASSSSAVAIANTNVQVIQEAPQPQPATQAPVAAAPAAVTSLPSTGPGSILAMFGLTTIAASFVHQLLIRRQRNTQLA